MAVKAKNTITLVRTDDGLPAFVHNAWANSPDGTVDFTTVYPNENLFKMEYTSRNLGYFGGNLATATFYDDEDGWIVSAGATDTNYIPGTRLYVADDQLANGVKVTIYVESDHARAPELFYRCFAANGTATGTQKSAGLKVNGATTLTLSIDEGTTYINVGAGQRTTDPFKSRIKIEIGEISTLYTPSPQDDPIGAYMKYMGTCSNHSETAPTDPSAYHWEVDPTYLEHSKVNGNDYENDKGTIYEALEDKANSNELNSIRDQADNLLSSFNSFTGKGGKHEKDLYALEQRSIALYKELGEGLLKLTFVNTWFKAGEEGLVIGTDGSNIKMLLNNESLSFLDGGKVVAYFTNQNFYINKGAVVKSLQVGSHAMISLGEEDTVVQFVGGAIA